MNIDKFIRSIRDIFGYYPDSSEGGKKFAELLVGLFGGDLFCNNGHYIVLIDGMYYDLYGSYVEQDLVQYPFQGELISASVTDFIPVEIAEYHINSTLDYEFKYDTGL